MNSKMEGMEGSGPGVDACRRRGPTTIRLQESDRAGAVRRGKALEYATVAYNSLEGMIGISAGLLAGSVALVGFGFDSAVEVTSGAVLLWRLRADLDPVRRERVEAVGIRIVGICFLVLSLYIGYDSVRMLFLREAPSRSLPGIALAVASLVVMPLLAKAKRRVAQAISSNALAADAKQTELCMYLSAILLGGLALNAALGWWWADPVAGLIMIPIIVREGLNALKGRTCCDHCSD
jgi:divalent metal cation (Fe/Co/Zn/Cd) transporter